uniref:Uncharacterized protein n=1 Tax=Arundo donax TaxID=35708 RepID=A0A0A8ZMP6_ARUDO
MPKGLLQNTKQKYKAFIRNLLSNRENMYSGI